MINFPFGLSLSKHVPLDDFYCVQRRQYFGKWQSVCRKKEQRPFPEGGKWPLHAAYAARRRGKKKQGEKETKGRRFRAFHVAYVIKTSLVW